MLVIWECDRLRSRQIKKAPATDLGLRKNQYNLLKHHWKNIEIFFLFSTETLGVIQLVFSLILGVLYMRYQRGILKNKRLIKSKNEAKKSNISNQFRTVDSLGETLAPYRASQDEANISLRFLNNNIYLALYNITNLTNIRLLKLLKCLESIRFSQFETRSETLSYRILRLKNA